jgi:hypothetical protein
MPHTRTDGEAEDRGGDTEEVEGGVAGSGTKRTSGKLKLSLSILGSDGCSLVLLKTSHSVVTYSWPANFF